MAGRLSVGFALLFSSVFAFPQTSTSSVSIDNSGDHPANTIQVTQSTPKPSAYGGAARKRYHSPAFVLSGDNLEPALSQNETNGASVLGTRKAPKLPKWLNGPLPQGKPWGGRTAKNTNPYINKDLPHTGITRHYEFTITEQTIAPDGFNRSGMVINGAFPGPTIEANWGDWIEVIVHNDLPDEGTSLHWHGLLQTQTPWFDGVPSVQQCPIAPGSTFTYRFRADLYGSSFYHSHYSAQYADGIIGAMIIYGPRDNTEYDVDLGPVLLTDYYHNDYYSIIEQVMAPASQGAFPPTSNNNLINGKMNYPCVDGTNCTPNAGISKFYFESGKSYLLRLINGGAEGIQKFSIDGYKLKIVANDFVPVSTCDYIHCHKLNHSSQVVPYDVDVVTLGIGQRTDIVVEAKGNSTDAVWMRSTLGPSAFVGGCNLVDGISPEAVAAIYYESANDTALPTTTSTVTDDELANCDGDDLSLSVPYFKITPPKKPKVTQEVDITFQSNGTHVCCRTGCTQQTLN
jgi:FtsP/CotA-like multicopper oxidase with cupredoxin domain